MRSFRAPNRRPIRDVAQPLFCSLRLRQNTAREHLDIHHPGSGQNAFDKRDSAQGAVTRRNRAVCDLPPFPLDPPVDPFNQLFPLTHTPLSSAHAAWASIGEIADVLTPKSTNRDDFIAESQAGAFDGCTVAYRTFASVEVTGKVDSSLLEALPRSLRFICHNGAGYDQVDVPACTARGIRVSNTPTAVDDATADIGIFLLLGALRNLAVSMASLRAGLWRGKTLPALGHDPQGRVLGILGMGGIGRNMAKKALAFGMEIRYHNRMRLDPSIESEIKASYVDFDTLLAESDVLSLNLPLNVSSLLLFYFIFSFFLAGILITTLPSQTHGTSSPLASSPR